MRFFHQVSVLRDRIKIKPPIDRITLIRKILCLFFVLGVILSFNLWISERFFPNLPFFDLIPPAFYPFDYILLFSFLICLMAGIFTRAVKLFYLIVSLLSVLLLQDQMRWQPWVYLYYLMLLPYLCKDLARKEEDIIRYFQIIFIGIYVWSAIHKLNPNFLEFTFNRMLHLFLNIQSPGSMQKLGYFIPLTEILIGVCLFIPKLRNLGVSLAILSHIFILVYLSPWFSNQNTVVYPWNIAMIALVFLIFYGKQQCIFTALQKIKSLNFFAIVLIWLLPFLNLWGRWDHYLSFSLYSGKTPNFYIAVEKNEFQHLPRRLAPYQSKIDQFEGKVLINIKKWAFRELNVPFYPESRVFQQLARSFCALDVHPDSLVFIEFERPLSELKYQTCNCSDLVKP